MIEAEVPTIDALEIEVTAPCPTWQEACPEAVTLAREAARLALRRGAAPFAAVVDITLADDATQRALNRTWIKQVILEFLALVNPGQRSHFP